MKRRTLLLLAGVLVLTVVPLLLPVTTEQPFGGADGQAQAAITAMYPDYQPWFTPWWEPPSSEIASLLFALQAALGAGLLGYYIGYKHGQSRHRRQDKADAGD
jgi:cobalt/nickel transport protein